MQVMFGLFYGLCFIPVVLSIVYPNKHVLDRTSVVPGLELVPVYTKPDHFGGPQTPKTAVNSVLALSTATRRTSEI